MVQVQCAHPVLLRKRWMLVGAFALMGCSAEVYDQQNEAETATDQPGSGLVNPRESPDTASAILVDAAFRLKPLTSRFLSHSKFIRLKHLNRIPTVERDRYSFRSLQKSRPAWP